MTLDVARDDGEVTIGFYIASTDIARLITFENSHLVGYSLFHSNPEAAVALHNELEYYIKGSSC